MPRPPLHDLALQALAKGATVRLRAASGSMRPTIRAGALLLVRGETPELSDIAVVCSPRGLVAHRVLEIHPDGYVLKGDAPGASPHVVAHDDVVGRVIAVQQDVRAWALRVKAAARGLVPARGRDLDAY